MKSINFRMLALLIVTTLVVAGAVHGLHIAQVGAQKSALLREASRAKEKGDYAEAVANFSRYLLLEPTDSKAHAEYATLLMRKAVNRKAFFALEEAVRRSPERTDLRRDLVRVAMQLGRHVDALPHLAVDPKKVGRELEPRPEFAADAEMLCYLAQCNLTLHDFVAARIQLDAAIEADPARIETWLEFIEVLDKHTDKKQPEAAAKKVNELVERNPNNVEALIVRAKFVLTRRHKAAVRRVFASAGADDMKAADELRAIAGADAAKVLELDPKSIEARLLLAQCAQEVSDFAQAERLLEEAKALSPQSDVIYGRLADLKLQSAEKPQEAAIAELKKGLAVSTDKKALLWNLAGLYIDTKKTEAASAIIKELNQTDHPKPLVGFLEDRLLVADDRWLEASKRLEHRRGELNDWPHVLKQADFQLGHCYSQLGKNEIQLVAYQRAVSADPYWTPARVGFANALLATGRINESLEQFKLAAATKGAPADLLIEVARLMILSNLALDPADREWASVRYLLDEIARRLPDSYYPDLLRAEILSAEGDPDEAEKLLAEAANKKPKVLEFRLSLSALARRRGDWIAAEKLLDRAKTDLGDSVAWRLARGRFLAGRDGLKAAPELRELASATEAFDDADKLQLYRGLAGIAYSVGDYPQLEKLCGLAAEKDAMNLRIRLLQFDLVLRNQREWLEEMRRQLDAENEAASDAAKPAAEASATSQTAVAGEPLRDRDQQLSDLLAKVELIEGKGPLWNYGNAVRLMMRAQKALAEAEDTRLAKVKRDRKSDEAKADLKAAREHVKAAKIERPTWSRLPLISGQIDDLDEEFDNALINYLDAVDNGERDPVVIARVTRLLYERQRYTQADDLMRRLQSEQTPFSGDLVRIAADISLQLNNAERALDLAQKAAAASNRYLDHIWLGQVLGMAGKTAQAQATLGEAIAKNPTAPEGYVALVGVLARAKLTDEAKAVIELADKIEAEKKPLAIASCWESLSDLPQAEARYRAAIAQFPDSPEVVRRVAEHTLRSGKIQEAIGLLDKLVSGEVDAGKEGQAWGRRNLALALSQLGGFDNYQKSMKLLEENLNTGDSIADRRTLALALAMWPSRQNRLRAIELLENVVKESRGGVIVDGAGRAESRAEDRYILASLYSAEARQLRAAKQNGDVEWNKARSLLMALLSERKNDPRYNAAYSRYLSAYVRLLLENGEAIETRPWVVQLASLAKDSLPAIELRTEALAAAGRASDALELLRATAARADLAKKDPSELSLAMARAAEAAGDICSGGTSANATLKKNEELAKQFYAEAEKQFRAAAAIEGVDPLSWENFIVRRKRLAEALDSIEKQSSVNPDALAGFAQRTMQHVAADTDGIARLATLVERALTSSQDSLALHTTLADIWNWLGQFDRAEERYRWVIDKDPKQAVALNNLALLLALRGKDLQKAEAHINEAIKIAGPQGELLDSRAIIRLASGNPKGALEDLTLAIDDAPTAPRLFHLALVQSRLKEFKADEKAAEALQRADEFGLSSEVLHPLERPSLEKLRTTLAEVNR